MQKLLEQIFIVDFVWWRALQRGNCIKSVCDVIVTVHCNCNVIVYCIKCVCDVIVFPNANFLIAMSALVNALARGDILLLLYLP